jgi:hypothetical protein
MTTIIDIILSILLGGILLLVVLSANDLTAETTYMLNGDLFVQQTLVSIVQIVEGEIRNMGYGMADTLRGAADTLITVVVAKDTAIAFVEDIGLDGLIDTVRYYTGPVSELAGTPNDSDRFLYRQVNSSPRNAIGVVTRFHLRYFSQGEADTLVPPIPSEDLVSIRVIEITLEVQNPYALYRHQSQVGPGERNALYSSSMWRQTRLASQNLRR